MIMKKIYNSPELVVVKVSTITMIATSTPVNLKDAEEYEEGGELTGVRRHNAWDDEELEEEEDF
jgi:hypothetical protein